MPTPLFSSMHISFSESKYFPEANLYEKGIFRKGKMCRKHPCKLENPQKSFLKVIGKHLQC